MAGRASASDVLYQGLVDCPHFCGRYRCLARWPGARRSWSSRRRAADGCSPSPAVLAFGCFRKWLRLRVHGPNGLFSVNRARMVCVVRLSASGMAVAPAVVVAGWPGGQPGGGERSVVSRAARIVFGRAGFLCVGAIGARLGRVAGVRGPWVAVVALAVLLASAGGPGVAAASAAVTRPGTAASQGVPTRVDGMTAGHGGKVVRLRRRAVSTARPHVKPRFAEIRSRRSGAAGRPSRRGRVLLAS